MSELRPETMHRLLVLGLSHVTAPLELRERLALSVSEQGALLTDVISARLANEAMVLVTCNRIELYVASDDPPASDPLVELLASRRSLPADDLLRHLYVKRDREVVEHAFLVASGLDSMVLGETQVLGQFREAYERAQRRGATGATLNPVMQRAIAAGRDAVARSGLAGLRPSVAGVAVELAERRLGGVAGRSVLSIGAGKMSGIALRLLAERKPARLTIANRDRGRAQAVASTLGGQGVGLDRLETSIAQADLVLSSTGAALPVVTRELCERALRGRADGRPLLLIDMGLPRDIEPAVAEIGGVTLLNLDDLQRAAADEQHPKREQAIEAARRIVANHLADFDDWQRQRSLGPVIDRLYQRSHALAELEVERALADFPGIGDEEREHWRALARRVVNQLLHLPVSNLKDAESPHHSANAYLRAMEHLFSLDRDDAADETRDYTDFNDERPAGSDD
jgi:glutamyl-tRNA reductase